MPFLSLFITLPTKASTGRMRVWRALKALGCATLRDGVYLLPDSTAHAQALAEIAAEAVAADGTGDMYRLEGCDAAQDAALRCLFDRSADYALLAEGVRALRQQLADLDAAQAGKRTQTLGRRLEQLGAIDYFPGEARRQTLALLDELRLAVERLRTPDEPEPVTGSIPRLDPAEYCGRTWATRARPWVDRLASAWLIRRHIDPEARLIWLADLKDCPPDGLGFDFDGARFTHVGARVTFETLLAAFALEADPALTRLGALVHYLDAGGLPVPEAAGLEALLGGLRASEPDDDALLAAALPLFDWLYRSFHHG